MSSIVYTSIEPFIKLSVYSITLSKKPSPKTFVNVLKTKYQFKNTENHPPYLSYKNDKFSIRISYPYKTIVYSIMTTITSIHKKYIQSALNFLLKILRTEFGVSKYELLHSHTAYHVYFHLDKELTLTDIFNVLQPYNPLIRSLNGSPYVYLKFKEGTVMIFPPKDKKVYVRCFINGGEKELASVLSKLNLV